MEALPNTPLHRQAHPAVGKGEAEERLLLPRPDEGGAEKIDLVARA